MESFDKQIAQSDSYDEVGHGACRKARHIACASYKSVEGDFYAHDDIEGSKDIEELSAYGYDFFVVFACENRHQTSCENYVDCSRYERNDYRTYHAAFEAFFSSVETFCADILRRKRCHCVGNRREYRYYDIVYLECRAVSRHEVCTRERVDKALHEKLTYRHCGVLQNAGN